MFVATKMYRMRVHAIYETECLYTECLKIYRVSRMKLATQFSLKLFTTEEYVSNETGETVGYKTVNAKIHSSN